MGNFFGSFYCMLGLDQFFGLDLANYLWGLTSAMVTTNQFVGVGLWMFGLTLIFVLSYYYFIAKPRWANIWGWLSFMGVNAIVQFVIGWQWVLYDLWSDKMMDANGVALPITESNCLCFGVTNALLSLFVFFAFSLIVKWRSTNASQVPF